MFFNNLNISEYFRIFPNISEYFRIFPNQKDFFYSESVETLHRDLIVWPDQAAVDQPAVRPEEQQFLSRIRTGVGKTDNPAGRPQTRVVVAPKGPSYVFSPWEALDWARWREVYRGLVPKRPLSLGGIL